MLEDVDTDTPLIRNLPRPLACVHTAAGHDSRSYGISWVTQLATDESTNHRSTDRVLKVTLGAEKLKR
jgi:hypothetical protein